MESCSRAVAVRAAFLAGSFVRAFAGPLATASPAESIGARRLDALASTPHLDVSSDRFALDGGRVRQVARLASASLTSA